VTCAIPHDCRHSPRHVTECESAGRHLNNGRDEMAGSIAIRGEVTQTDGRDASADAVDYSRFPPFNFDRV